MRRRKNKIETGLLLLAGLPLLLGFWSPNFEDHSTPEENNRALAEKKRRRRIAEMRKRELYPDGRPAQRNYI